MGAGRGRVDMHDQGAPFGRRHASNLCQRGVCERYADVLRLAPVQTVTALLGLQGLCGVDPAKQPRFVVAAPI
jgi:hypothetical protein